MQPCPIYCRRHLFGCAQADLGRELLEHACPRAGWGQQRAIGMATERSAATRHEDSLSLSRVGPHVATRTAAERSATTRREGSLSTLTAAVGTIHRDCSCKPRLTVYPGVRRGQYDQLRKSAGQRQCLSHNAAETQGRGSVLATKAAEIQGRGSVLATEAAGTRGRGSVFATKTAGTQGRGSVLATKTAETPDRGSVAPASPAARSGC